MMSWKHKLKEAAQLVKATPENLAEKITHLQAENKSLKGEVESLKSKMAQERSRRYPGPGERSKRCEASCSTA